jgi:hypothetical protein
MEALFKGKTTIELHDAKTGKLLQKTEDNNMVTKALDYFAEYGGLTNPSIFYNSNLRNNFIKQMLGGVICLDTAIAENNEIVRVPGGVKMIANGARDVLNTGDPIELGSYNENESGWQVDGSLKLVWDWTTSQGNGTIACVCLSSLMGGMQGIGNQSLTAKANPYAMGDVNSVIEIGAMPIGHLTLGVYNNVLYAISSDTAFSSTFEILKYSFPMDSMDIRDTHSPLRLIDTVSVSNPHSLSDYNNGYYSVYQDGRYAYLFRFPARVSGSYYTRTFYFNNDNSPIVYKFDLENNCAIAATYVVSPSATGADPINDMGYGVYPTMLGSNKYMVFNKYIFELNNLTNFKEITNYVNAYDMQAVNQDIAMNGGRRLDMTTGLMLPVNSSAIYNKMHIVNSYSPLLGLYYDAPGANNGDIRYVVRDPRFIATINNLEEPVVKTPDKTMKVTYTISFT